MSGVIWGSVKLNKQENISGFGNEIIEQFSAYKIDKFRYIKQQNVVMGCGLIYITEESKNEILPYYDEEDQLMITADAIIDNREELFADFGINKEIWDTISDSQLILMAYKKWKKDAPKYLIGDFAFAIWDDQKKELFCTRDGVGTRTLYYYKSKDVFAFCTVMKPLVNTYCDQLELNQRWITEFFTLPAGTQEYECNETIYNEIIQFPVAKSITVSEHHFEITQFWNPLKDMKPIRYKNSEDYINIFNKIFDEAVRCRLRGIGEFGTMMSGGLDSGAVATVAASILAEQDKRLKAFCAVPMKEFEREDSKYKIYDETEYAQTIVEHSGNIDIAFVDCEGITALTHLGHYLNSLEQPYKLMENITWINDIYKQSSDIGCKVILKGQFGNATISRGDFIVHALTLFREFRYCTLIKEIIKGSRFHGIPTKFVAKQVLGAIIPYRLKVLKHKILNKKKSFDRFSNTPINRELIDRWGVEKRFDKKNINLLVNKVLDFYESNEFILDDMTFAHLGAYDTKFGLAHGIIMRDPTKDKRVIEYCLNIPYTQYVKDGVERCLIRNAMKDKLPDKVRLNHIKRGVQGSDWIDRLYPHREEIMYEFNTVINLDYIKHFFDLDKLKQLISDETIWDEKNGSLIRLILTTIVFNRFYQEKVG